LAGSIPIYSGSDLINEIVKPGAFVNINNTKSFITEGGEDEWALKAAHALLNPSVYEEALQRNNVLQDGALEKFFSWHPSVWPHNGDDLIQRILYELRVHCWRQIQKLPDEMYRRKWV
jgi:hypothetical protein